MRCGLCVDHLIHEHITLAVRSQTLGETRLTCIKFRNISPAVCGQHFIFDYELATLPPEVRSVCRDRCPHHVCCTFTFNPGTQTLVQRQK